MLTHCRRVKDVDTTDAEQMSRLETSVRNDYFRTLHYLREHMPGWEDAYIRETLPQLGIRQSRRVRGEYTITDDDLGTSRHFEDTIARLGASLSFSDQGYKLYDRKRLHYDIPYRCLIPKETDGLLVAGRCISADFLADNSLRLIVPCFATGQAAGTAAALAADQGIQPRHIAIGQLQDTLVKQGAYLGRGEQAEPPPIGDTTDMPTEIWDD